MPNVGIASTILLNKKAILGAADPSVKITPVGTLACALNAPAPKIIQSTIDPRDGYIRNVNLRGHQRDAGSTYTTDDCAADAIPSYTNQVIPALTYRKKGLFFDFNTLEQYEANALEVQRGGTPDLGLAAEMVEAFNRIINTLLKDVNGDGLTFVDNAWGVNAASGSSNVRTCNFPLAGTNNNLAQGFTMLQTDAATNEVQWSNLDFVGSGLSYAAFLQLQANAISANQSGVNNAQLAWPRYFFDPVAASNWGAQEFAMIERNALQFVNICKFRGYKSGVKGDSSFGTMMLTGLTDALGNPIRDIEIDLQLKQVTCPEDLVIIESDDYPSATSVGRGAILIASMNYAYIKQTNMYATGDRLEGNNGIYHYVATNS